MAIKNFDKITKFMKILTIVYMTLVFIGILLPDAFVLTFQPNELEAKYIPQAIIRWLQYVSFFSFTNYCFF